MTGMLIFLIGVRGGVGSVSTKHEVYISRKDKMVPGCLCLSWPSIELVLIVFCRMLAA